MLVYTILISITFILWPEMASAWGPGTHLETANELLVRAAVLAPAVTAIITKFKDEFIYGMVSPDVIVGKKYAGFLHHCHNWKTGWKILEKCTTDRQRASAYGYLAHLAADSVAHNYYVPYMIIRSYEEGLLDHTYWEMRFDMHVSPSTWDDIRRIIRADFTEFDDLLDRNLKRPLFSFKTNKKIFSTILLIQQFEKLRKMVEFHARLSKWPLTPAEVGHYKGLICEVTTDLLTNLKKAGCLKGEPVGEKRLVYAAHMRRSLTRLVHRGLTDKENIDRFIEKIRAALEENLLKPNAEMPDAYRAL